MNNANGRYDYLSYNNPDFRSDLTSPGKLGELRMSNGNIYVWDGLSWLRTLDGVISHNAEFESIISWVKSKIKEEQEIQQLVKEYPSLKEAKENYDILLAMLKSTS